MAGSTRNSSARSSVSGCFLTLAACFSTIPIHAQEPSTRPFELDDGIDGVGVSSPRISPDGTRVLFMKQELDWDENKRNARIWMKESTISRRT